MQDKNQENAEGAIGKDWDPAEENAKAEAEAKKEADQVTGEPQTGPDKNDPNPPANEADDPEKATKKDNVDPIGTPNPNETVEAKKAKDAKKTSKLEEKPKGPQPEPNEFQDHPDEKGTVVIESGDHRVLEVQIGENKFRGRAINVPTELADEARNVLRGGGFSIK